MTIQEYNLTTEDRNVLTTYNQSESSTQNDNRIAVTLDKTLKYLKEALQINEIAAQYKKHFAYTILKARITSANQIEKDNLVKQMCNEIASIDSSGMEFDTLEKIKMVSSFCFALDENRGEFFFIANEPYINKNVQQTTDKINPKNPWAKVDCSLLNYYINRKANLMKVNISENPSIADWKVVATDLIIGCPEGWDMFFWHEEWKYRSVYSQKTTTFPTGEFSNIVFTSENDKTEEYMNTKGLSTNLPDKDEDPNYQYLKRKYLVLTERDNSQRYFKSPMEISIPLIPDERNHYPNFLPLSSIEPTSGCIFLKKNDLFPAFSEDSTEALLNEF